MTEGKVYPASDRNKGPISEALSTRLPKTGCVLEVASGPGQHVLHFAKCFPHLTFQPSDQTSETFEQIRSNAQAEDLAQILDPIVLDVQCPPRDLPAYAAIICINMLHISQRASLPGLFHTASRCLPEGHLFVYGPFFLNDGNDAPSNLRFDHDLRARNPNWGVHPLADVRATAQDHGFALVEKLDMPANNLLLVFVRT